jgi:hypothetical protein
MSILMLDIGAKAEESSADIEIPALQAYDIALRQ